ncbi:hypothetical protein Taro_035986 [Colocasia esculenta]|uniref:Uncharacterized protein n=1 Tax=Colocasia esculenta TaxID=4460 RepID=A0A843W0D5_COLES|nr:hypothetical protein [Colocasia esculenta]
MGMPTLLGNNLDLRTVWSWLEMAANGGPQCRRHPAKVTKICHSIFLASHCSTTPRRSGCRVDVSARTGGPGQGWVGGGRGGW